MTHGRALARGFVARAAARRATESSLGLEAG
jgi:hypothetical protein